MTGIDLQFECAHPQEAEAKTAHLRERNERLKQDKKDMKERLRIEKIACQDAQAREKEAQEKVLQAAEKSKKLKLQNKALIDLRHIELEALDIELGTQAHSHVV